MEQLLIECHTFFARHRLDTQDAEHHLANAFAHAILHIIGNKNLCKFYYSQVYQNLKLADGQSVQILLFDFGSSSCARECFSRSAFISFVRQCLDHVVRKTWRTKYVDDIKNAPQTSQELNTILKLGYQCIDSSVCISMHRPFNLFLMHRSRGNSDCDKQMLVGS